MIRLLALLLCLLSTAASAQQVTVIGGGSTTTSAIPSSPGYLPNTYQPGSVGPATSGTAYGVAGVAVCYYSKFDWSFTVGSLMTNISGTAGSSNEQLAMYTNDPTTHRPGVVVVNTPSFADTANGAIATAVSQGNTALSAAGYWMCSNANDATVVNIGATASPLGSTSAGGAAASSSLVVAVSATMTFGTWTSPATGLTWAEVGLPLKARIVEPFVISSP